MSLHNYNLASLGDKAIVNDDDLLGQVAVFQDLDYTSTDSIKPVLSNRKITAILCRNESGGTLAAGTVCDWDTGATYGVRRAVAGAAGATDIGAGVVDSYISSAVADNESFWLIVDGPCRFLFTTGTTLAVRDLLATAASGRAQKATVGNTSDHYTIGFADEAVDTAIASDTLFKGIANFK